MAEISVIVPIYKVEAYIHRCVDSILNQTFQNIEIILVEDGSPDNCGEICDEYQKKDQRVIAIHKKNEGLAAARNTGLNWVFKNSDSKWISFVDSDDWLHPEMLEKLYTAATQCAVKMSVCSYERTESDLHSFPQELLDVKKIEAEKFYREYGVNATIAWGKLYKRCCFEEIRYPVGKLHEDEFVTYKIIFECKQIAMIEAPLYAYFVNPRSIMNQWSPKRLDSLEAIQERIEFFEKRGLIELQYEQEIGYIWNIVNHIKEIEQSDDNIRKQYENKMRHLLRRELKKQRKKITFKNNKWFYEAAYPKLMCIYWKIYNMCKR